MRPFVAAVVKNVISFFLGGRFLVSLHLSRQQRQTWITDNIGGGEFYKRTRCESVRGEARFHLLPEVF